MSTRSRPVQPFHITRALDKLFERGTFAAPKRTASPKARPIFTTIRRRSEQTAKAPNTRL